jgi:hypothetical protein
MRFSEIDDVLIEQAYAAAGDDRANGLQLGGAVLAGKRVAAVATEIERARPARTVGATFQPPRRKADSAPLQPSCWQWLQCGHLIFSDNCLPPPDYVRRQNFF